MKHHRKTNRRRVKTLVDGAVLALTIAYLLTGLGITHYRVIEPATLGFLSKNVSFHIHEKLFVPFLLCLILHLLVSHTRALGR